MVEIVFSAYCDNRARRAKKQSVQVVFRWGVAAGPRAKQWSCACRTVCVLIWQVGNRRADASRISMFWAYQRTHLLFTSSRFRDKSAMLEVGSDMNHCSELLGLSVGTPDQRD